MDLYADSPNAKYEHIDNVPYNVEITIKPKPKHCGVCPFYKFAVLDEQFNEGFQRDCMLKPFRNTENGGFGVFVQRHSNCPLDK